jgi:hypothetical protein
VHKAVAVVISGLDAEAVHCMGDARQVLNPVMVKAAVSPGLYAFGAGPHAVPAKIPLAAVAPGLLDEEVAVVGVCHAVSEGVGLLDHVSEFVISVACDDESLAGFFGMRGADFGDAALIVGFDLQFPSSAVYDFFQAACI